MPVLVSGPLDNPWVTIEDGALRQALVDAGRSELAGRLGDGADALLEDAGVDNDAVRDALEDGVGGAIGDLFGGGRKNGGREAAVMSSS